MARPKKVGLDYFPMDVDIFEDPKVERVTAKFGAAGDGIMTRLLCRIYREGYGTVFDEDVARAIALKVGDREQYTLVIAIVEELLRVGFFHEGIYRAHGVLTSHGIQARFEKACTGSGRKNNKVPAALRLLDGKPGLPAEETPEEDDEEEAENSLLPENYSLPGRKPMFSGRENPQRKVNYIGDDDDNYEYASARVREPRIVLTWREAFGRLPTPAQVETLEWRFNTYCERGGMEAVVFAEALRLASEAGAINPLAYSGTLLNNWMGQNIHTMDDLAVSQCNYDMALGRI